MSIVSSSGVIVLMVAIQMAAFAFQFVSCVIVTVVSPVSINISGEVVMLPVGISGPFVW